MPALRDGLRDAGGERCGVDVAVCCVRGSAGLPDKQLIGGDTRGNDLEERGIGPGRG